MALLGSNGQWSNTPLRRNGLLIKYYSSNFIHLKQNEAPSSGKHFDEISKFAIIQDSPFVSTLILQRLKPPALCHIAMNALVEHILNLWLAEWNKQNAIAHRVSFFLIYLYKLPFSRSNWANKKFLQQTVWICKVLLLLLVFCAICLSFYMLNSDCFLLWKNMPNHWITREMEEAHRAHHLLIDGLVLKHII